MKKMKHYIIIGVEVILFGIISASAATSVPSHGVSYSNDNSKANVSTVEAALNELYSGYTYGTATASQILTGKTALIKGTKVTGTMANKAGATQAGTGFSKTETGTIGESGYKATGSIKIPVAGYYNTDSTLTFDLTDNNNSYYATGSEQITISGTVYGTNNSAGGYVSATGYASFLLPKNTKVDFTVVRGSWSFKANGTDISTGFITTNNTTTVEMTGTIPSGAAPRPEAKYTFTLNYSN